MTTGKIYFQFKGATSAFPGGSIPPLGTKDSVSTEHKVEGMESKNVSRRAFGIIVRGDAFISAPWSLGLCALAVKEVEPYTGHLFRAWTASYLSTT